jgi:hypothetical protein
MSSITDSSKSACMKILCQQALILAEFSFSLGSLEFFPFWFLDIFESRFLWGPWKPSINLNTMLYACLGFSLKSSCWHFSAKVFCHSHFAFLFSLLRACLAFFSISCVLVELYFIKFLRAEFLFSISWKRRLSDSVKKSDLWVISCSATSVAEFTTCSLIFWKSSGVGSSTAGSRLSKKDDFFPWNWDFQWCGGGS